MGDTRSNRIDQFVLMHSARTDRWRDVTHLAAGWAAGRGDRTALEAAVGAMAPVEEYHAYPGAPLLAALSERIARNDAGGTAQLARRISNALMTRSFASGPVSGTCTMKWRRREVADMSPGSLAKRAPTGPISRFCSWTASPRRAGPLWPPNGAGYDARKMRSSMSRSL